MREPESRELAGYGLRPSLDLPRFSFGVSLRSLSRRAVNNCSIICYASLRRTVPCDTEARREGQRGDNGHQFVVSPQLLGEHIETERGKENDRV
jgi:hypothetical protein